MDDGGPGAAVPESGAGQARSSATSPGKDGPRSVEGVLSSSSSILDLSRSGLRHLGELFKTPTLQHLHLQRNALRAIPADFFQLLPHLTWLDLRHNQIEALPPGVGAHRHLQALLLERNPVRALPAELGNVSTLKALNLRHCPLESPPPPVVQRGLAAILRFLRAAGRPLPRDPAWRATPSVSQTALRPWPRPARGLPGAPALHGEAVRPQGPEGPPLKGQASKRAPVGTPDPSDVGRSAGSSEDWPRKEELRRFWKLRQEIVEKEQAETLARQLLALRLPPNLRAVLCNREGVHPDPRRGPREDQAQRCSAATLSRPRRKLPLCGGARPGPARPLEASPAAALREPRERMEHTRDGTALPAWREQALAVRTRREALGTALPPRRALVRTGRWGQQRQ